MRGWSRPKSRERMDALPVSCAFPLSLGASLLASAWTDVEAGEVWAEAVEATRGEGTQE